MYQMMPYWLELTMAVIWLALLTPIPYYIVQVWPRRRAIFLSRFNENAFKSYLLAFFPEETISPVRWRRQLENRYNSIQHRGYFIVSYVLFAGLLTVGLAWIFMSVSSWLDEGTYISAGPLAISALIGGFIWVGMEQLRRCRTGVFSAHDIHGMIFRIIISVPVGYCLASIFKEVAAVPLALALGAFPTSDIIRMMKRAVDPLSPMKNPDCELLRIAGITPAEAELLQDENVNSILQMAYIDPIELSIKTGLDLIFIMDCKGQALLLIYVDENQRAILKKCGLRSAQEIFCLMFDFSGEDEMNRFRAQKVIEQLTATLDIGEQCAATLLRQVSEDPHTNFLNEIWYTYCNPSETLTAKCQQTGAKN